MLRILVQKQPPKFYAANHHIYDDLDRLIATTYGEDYKRDKLLAAAADMQLALTELKRLSFGSSGNSKEWAAAVMFALHALELSEGKVNEH